MANLTPLLPVLTTLPTVWSLGHFECLSPSEDSSAWESMSQRDWNRKRAAIWFCQWAVKGNGRVGGTSGGSLVQSCVMGKDQRFSFSTLSSNSLKLVVMLIRNMSAGEGRSCLSHFLRDHCGAIG